ncbi:hypothetical protein E3P99_01190 [Wallemia hederae]|uniref:Proteasome assembly chaperone 2 n=1 Tax=Wallemia hederae TaxID=1540922 RepID=A0A4T0FSG7_9BASI|nr:hypothetical protein E3P99_01190 [Wallemia hederae]
MSFVKYEININESELQGKTLALPCISIANVPQLAVELLLNNHASELVGRFNNEGFIQVAGGSESGVVTPMELRRLRDYKDVLVVDQRSPLLKSHKNEFVEQLSEWATKLKLNTVLLSSADSASRGDDEIMSSQLRQLSSEHALYSDKVSAFQPLELSNATGAGLLKSYYTSLAHATALCLFTTEGDNRGDARLLVMALSNVIGLKAVELRDPKHWEGLFGRLYDAKLFG